MDRSAMEGETRRRLRLRASTQRIVSGDSLVLALGSARARLRPFDQTAEKVLWRLADGVDVVEELRSLPGERRPAFAEWFDTLRRGDLLEPADADGTTLADTDLLRFDRLLNRLATYESPDRDRWKILESLRGRTVAVLGVGGLASWVLYNLVCCGVGRLRLIDADVVELSNLNRSILFAEADVGRRKIDAVRDSLLRFAPRTVIEGVELQVTCADDLAEALSGVDLLIATGDKPAWLIREWVVVAGRRLGIPTLHPGRGRVGPFDLNDGRGCALCEWADLVSRHPGAPAQLATLRRLPQSDPGPISPVGGMTAAFTAQEAFRYLVGVEPVTAGRAWQLNPDLTSRLTGAVRNDRCPTCGSPDDPARVGPPSELIPGVGAAGHDTRA
ncbi:ThiF family adenylyltransferase [Actinomadura sp. DC4]|uniref:HesA/MoeB/ThiF family protein n=1 Tax=Actinomadura sp. DC4 TaxID=3055069 RepID=UPI0025B26DE7|nr:ThiF family adenylyltransferase [Actinomadura sp. DC4]MDN3354465.1 ThiF family adenylyltransferase [Actinomadura sp. DC4]